MWLDQLRMVNKMDNDDSEIGVISTPFKRVKTPTILQMEATECGATSLSIILAYYGLYISSEKAREMCGVSRDGSKAINIVKAARMLGMDAEGLVVQDIQALRLIEAPFIVFWKFEHFLVVEGIKKNKVYVNDPATGPKVISIEEFDKSFTGVVLLIAPGEDFKPSGKEEQSLWGLLYNYFKSDFPELSYIFLISIVLAIPQASLAFFIEFFIDNIVINEQTQWMTGFIGSMVFVITSIVILFWIQQYFIIRYKLLFSIKNVPLFFRKLLHLPMSFYTQRSSGDVANRMLVFDAISEKITKAISESVNSMLMIAIYSVIIIMINHVIGMVTLAITLINFSILILAKRKIADLASRFSYDQAKMFGIEYSGVQMIEELKFMSGENKFFSRWLGFKSKIIQTQQRIDFYTALISLLPSTLYFLNLVLLVIFSLHFVVQGTISIGGVIAIYTLILLISAPVINIMDHFLKINELKTDLVRIHDVALASKRTRVVNKKMKKKDLHTDHLIEIKKLTFGYSVLEAPILSDINLKIKKGHSIAITGISGGGKSSLLNLACGLYEPWLGEIYFNGKNIKNIPSKELYSKIAYVDQNIFLFEGTIRDNITMWDNSINDARINKVLKAVCIYDTIIAKGGLDYNINEGGTNISVGQAQRIELARALLKSPELILLDEVTSALDTVTEARIYENLRKMDCTFLIVAHRLSAIKHCDQIVLIENGSITESGSYEELMQQNGRFKEFILKDYLS